MPRARGLRLEFARSHHHLLLLRPCLPQSRQTSLSGDRGPCQTLRLTGSVQAAAAQRPSLATTLNARAKRHSAFKHRQAIIKHWFKEAPMALLHVLRHRLPAILLLGTPTRNMHLYNFHPLRPLKRP